MDTVVVLSKRSLPLCSDRPLPEPFCKALKYQNTGLIEAVARELGLSLESALELFHELKLFCYLCYSTKKRQAVPVRIDSFWHIFLDRQDEFGAFCRSCFGGTIEHIPLADHSYGNVNDTVDRAHDLFGSRISTKWLGATRCDAFFRAAA